MMAFPVKARAPISIQHLLPQPIRYGAKSRPDEKAQRLISSSRQRQCCRADARIRGPSFLHRPRIPSFTCGIRRFAACPSLPDPRNAFRAWNQLGHGRFNQAGPGRRLGLVGSDAPSSLRIATR